MRGSGWQLALARRRPSCSPGSRRCRRCATGSCSTSRRSPRPIRDFSMRRLLSEFRWPFALGLLLVVLDAVAGAGRAVAGPHRASTTGSAPARGQVLFAASAGVPGRRRSSTSSTRSRETFVTGRTSERIMAALRIRIWAQLQRLSLDYYEREMAGRIMTRMTTDVDQFESADRERPPGRPRLAGHLRRRRGRAAAARPRAGAVDPHRRDPARDRHRGLPARHQPPLRPGARVRSPSSTPTSRSRLSGHPRGAGVRARGPHRRTLPRARAALLRRAAEGPAH